MNRLADAAARRLIEERLDLNVLVEAGAGSGKTYSLARRMAAGIVSGKYDAQEMAAVTFTRKAAAELRGRFQLALEEKLPAARGEERARIERALANLEHLFAGTIHSFCAHLLRERPVEANIAPGFSELDELENTEWRQRSWRDYLSRLRGERSPLLDELQQARVSAKDLDGAFATVCTFDEVEFPAGHAQQPDMQAAGTSLDGFWQQLQVLMPQRVAPGAKCTTLERARRFRGLIRTATGGRPADIVEAVRCWETDARVTMKWWVGRVGADGEWEPGPAKEQRAVREKVETLVAEFQSATVGPTLKAWRQYTYRLVVTLLVEGREHAREERRRAVTLNYGDLLVAAAALLRNNAHVRAAMQRKYRWLFVDEFQDTDPIQAEVMLLLAAEPSGTSALRPSTFDVPPSTSDVLDPYALPLRPGALFVVGDPKQSIYRFRRADIDIYNRVRETIKRNGGQVVTLTTSFRARPVLCDWTNEVFSQLLPPEATSQQAAFRPLDADPDWTARTSVADETTGGGAPAPAYGKDTTGGKQRKGHARLAEGGLRTLTTAGDAAKGAVAARDAEAVASFIHAEVAAGRASWKDFLVLTRKRANLATYAASLQALDIPMEVSGAGAFGGSPLVVALVDLLLALGDPADGVAVVGVLRGPLFGVSDAELFAHRQAGEYFGFSAGKLASGSAGADPRLALSEHREPKGGPAVAGDGPVAAALARLGAYLRLTRTLPLAAAVERILEDSGFLALAAAAGTGAAPAGDLLHAIDLVRAVAEDGRSLADAAAALEEAAESSDVESVPLEPGRPEAVRVMNLHKAKGLEAPVVFLADPAGGVKKSAEVRIIRDGATARGYLAVSKEVGEHQSQLIAHPEGWDEHERAELEYVDAEETRLLYVAATRARELLVVSCWDKESKTRPWAAFDEYLFDAPELEIEAAQHQVRKTKGDALARTRAQAAAARARRLELASRPSWAVRSVTGDKAALRLAPEETVRPEQGGGESGSADDTAARPVHRADAGAAWGSFVHGLLEHAMKHPSVTRADLDRLASWLTVEAPELRPFIPDALDVVEVVSKTSVWQEAQAGNDVHAEVPFAIRLEDAASGGVRDLPTILHGVIDLVYRAADGWHILDYKTDLAADDLTLQVRHAPQLAQYQKAWERLTSEKVASVRAVGVRRNAGGR
jgi:ATP-dependent helicase/nuclease subunit A